MALFFTLLYLFASYLSPETLFGPLALYHIQLVIAIIALGVSLFTSRDSGLLKIPQTYALVGVAFAVVCSMIFNGLTRLAPATLLNYLPNAFAYVFVLLNCKKKIHLQLIIGTIFVACLYTIVRGNLALNALDLTSPYLLGQGTEAGVIYRIRGLSFISDPNDLAQVMVSLMPCLFLSWKPGRGFRNFLFVLLPSAILIYGMFLTHSRGAIVAMLAVAILTLRPRLGNIRSAIIGGIIFAATSAVGFSGGRDISVEAGQDRLAAWSVGLELIRTHPIFGVGYERFVEFNEITAHNTIVVCAAELGFVGLFFWVMFVLPTLRDSVLAGNPVKRAAGLVEADAEAADNISYEDYERARVRKTHLQAERGSTAIASVITRNQSPSTVVAVPYYAEEEAIDEISDSEIGRMARIMTISLAGYLTAGWFLSRAYAMTLFVYVGLAESIYQMALSRGHVPPRMKVSRLLRIVFFSSIGLIALVYVMLRVQHLAQ
jgi:O-Antigen ligase